MSIDGLSKAQGIARPSTIHEVVRARVLDGRRVRPASWTKVVGNGAFAKIPIRVVDYAEIDSRVSQVLHDVTLTEQFSNRESIYFASNDERIC